jgi:DNA helicase-2/ATP-dependent DNA helicase PcrA
MVVGDDDQTIYEWRGARPSYIIADFSKVFYNKPVQDYCLSKSFRFGPVIAQSSASLIKQNTQRVKKPLTAHQINKHGFVHVFNGGYDATKELTEQVIALKDVDRVPPANIVVLARLFAQMDSLESEFLAKEIPFRVDGQNPFFERIEVKVLLDYVRLGRDYHQPMTRESGKCLLSIANKPFRKLSRDLLYRLTKKARQSQLSPQEVLEMAACGKVRDMNHFQRNRITGLWQTLNQLSDKTNSPDVNAGVLLNWILMEVDYLSHFQDYYGKGEHADEKKQAVLNFLEYVTYTRVTVERLLDFIRNLDTTQGAPEEEQITFTTIFRTKGLEYDYVIIPQCNENALPYLKGERTTVYDTQGIYQDSPFTDQLESERRLFYVALTRARKGVLIGTSSEPSRFIQELQLQEGVMI